MSWERGGPGPAFGVPARGGRDRRKAKTPRALPGEGVAGLGVRRRPLLAQAELLDERAVLLVVAALEVVQQAAALAHHPEQPAARMEILDVRLEMIGEHVDALREERDLDFGRTGV